MGEPATDLHPTPTRIALLRDVQAGRVRDDTDFAPHLHYDEDGAEKTTRVADAIWAMERAGWVHQVTLDHVWRLTPAGRTVLEEADRG